MGLINYYDRSYDSSLFQGAGWRGRFILFLAWLNKKIERAIEWHVMHFIAEREQMPRDTVRGLETVFEQENEERRPRALDTLVAPQERDVRYVNRQFTPPGAKASTSMHRFLAAYADAGRAGTYRYARKQRLANPDGDVVQENE